MINKEYLMMYPITMSNWLRGDYYYIEEKPDPPVGRVVLRTNWPKGTTVATFAMPYVVAALCAPALAEAGWIGYTRVEKVIYG